MRSVVLAADLGFLAVAALVLASVGVGAGCTQEKTRSGGPSGAAGSTGAAGTGSTGTAGMAATGAAGMATTGAAGSNSTGAAGTTGAAGAATTGAAGVPATGAAGTGSGSGVDNGQLFRDAGAVVAAPDPVPSSDAGTRIEAGGMPVGMGTLHINSMGLTGVFTQKGADVTMVVTATNCAQGSHVLQIRGGFSCDNASTQGAVWDGKRGDGISPLVCGADKKGSLTYTRSGADPTTNWTVGDHNTKTDVTLHPAMAEGNCGTFF